MGHLYCTNLVHCVFSTKDRAPLIPAESQQDLWAYFAGIAKRHHIPLLAVGGITNHLHLLISIPQTLTVAAAMNLFKSNSSRWLRERHNEFEWQEGYGAFSVSPLQVQVVKEYIRTQPGHHAKRTFEEEFVSLLQKCAVAYDPKCVRLIPAILHPERLGSATFPAHRPTSYVPNAATSSFLPNPSTPCFSPTFLNASMAKSR